MSDTHMQIGTIVCPHCGYALDEADSEGAFYAEGGVETWCEKCDEEYTCYGSVTWYFTTKKGHVETARRASRADTSMQ